ncbi:MAG: hypothetical protein KGD63_12740 [Candidatus Lokiarchaeota archaeon]|nr:hypothetical protein [Candidatus Lokiarchaeota archaeon]
MTFGYCKNCKQNVLLKREKLNIGLIILLIIFTAGIGLLIYVWIHILKEKNLCIHCGTYSSPIKNNEKQSLINNQLSVYNKGTLNEINLYTENADSYRRESIIRISGDKINYCPLCGQEIDNKNIDYCSFCGEKQ